MTPGPPAIVARTREASHGVSSAGPAVPLVPASASWWQTPHVGMNSVLPRRSNAVRWT